MSRVQISAQQLGKTLSPAQRRFNQLTKQVTQLRARLTQWRDQLPPFRQSWHESFIPLRERLMSASRKWAFALDAALSKPNWTRSERRTMTELLCEEAGSLLQAAGEDADLKALYDKHSDMDFDSEKQEQLRDFKEFTEAMTGMDLGSDDFVSEEDLMQRVQERMQQDPHDGDPFSDPADDPFNPAFHQHTHKKTKKQLAAEQRREAEAATAKQSIRDIYRKLASALHPDKESDPTQRAVKTEVMARVNKAYESNDLLALLEAQLEIEHVDARSITVVSVEKLKHYNKVLAEQLDQLHVEQQEMQEAFNMEFAMPFGLTCTPAQWADVTRQQRQSMQQELVGYKDKMGLIASKDATKMWLRSLARQRRKRTPRFDMDFDDPF